MKALAPVRSADPAGPLLDLADAKAHLRVDFDDDNDLIAALVATAEKLLDGYSGMLGRALVTQTWQQSFDGFPACIGRDFNDRFRLPLGPLQAGATIQYYDTAGVQQDFTAFSAVSDAIGPMIVLDYGSWWPLTAIRPDAVTVTWTCGYGATPASVPDPILHAARLLIGDWYQNREDTVSERSVTPAALPNGVQTLLAPFRGVGS